MEHKKVYAIIVDDEDGCITNLLHYLGKLCPDVLVIATGNTLAEALGKAGSQRIDIGFLDIEIAGSNIFAAMDAAGNVSFKVVFVTAHQHYAIKAIKTAAFDYIMKPLSEDDIIACYSKIRRHFQLAADNKSGVLVPERRDKKIIIKNLDKIYILKPEDVYYISGSRAYSEITFVFNDEIKSVVICKVLNKIEEEYENPLFFRIHKSHIVNIGRIQSVVTINGLHALMPDEKMIPVAKRRSNDFLAAINNKT